MRTLYRARAVHTQAFPASGEWVLVDGRHVQRVGAGDPPAADRVVELPGCTILPVFADAHVPLPSMGADTANTDVAAAGSGRELLAIAAARAADEAELVVSLQ